MVIDNPACGEVFAFMSLGPNGFSYTALGRKDNGFDTLLQALHDGNLPDVFFPVYRAPLATAQASIATPNPPFSEVKALNNSLWMPNAELEKVNSEHDKWFIEFYTEGHKLREHDFYLPSLWAWQRQHLNKTQASIATPHPQSVRDALEKAADICEGRGKSLCGSTNHQATAGNEALKCARLIRALIEPLSAATGGQESEAQAVATVLIEGGLIFDYKFHMTDLPDGEYKLYVNPSALAMEAMLAECRKQALLEATEVAEYYAMNSSTARSIRDELRRMAEGEKK